MFRETLDLTVIVLICFGASGMPPILVFPTYDEIDKFALCFIARL
jgi:hypothetical protein